MTEIREKTKLEAMLFRNVEFFFMGLMVLLSAFTAIVSYRKKPFNGMKISFFILSIWICCGNLFLLLDSLFFPDHNLFSKPFPQAYSLILSGSVLVFGLFFPTFFRNLTSLTIVTSAFLGALATAFFLLSLLAPFLQEEGWVLAIFFVRALQLSILGFFMYLVTYKLEYSFPALESFIRVCYAGFLFAFLSTTILFFLGKGSIFLSKTLEILFFYNIAYGICFAAFLWHFTFSEHYLDHPFTYLKEFPEKLLAERANASPEGNKSLKSKLWNLYETRHWQSVMDSFWFQILVDETLDNALEHGGKRGSDYILVHVFESPRYIDVYVTDQGKGFNPKAVPNPLSPDRKLVPSGRGIHILKKLFSVRWNFLGNEVCIRIDKTKVVDMHSIPPT